MDGKFIKSYKTELELIDFARKYSINRLGFDKDHAFEKYDKSIYAYYFVQLSPRFRLKIRWESFENRREAKISASKKKTEGYDVYYRDVEAVGNKNLPITKSLLKCDLAEIAFTVPHEKWHNYAKPYSLVFRDCEIIEEACANAIGFNEASNIVKELYGNKSDEMKDVLLQLDSGREASQEARNIGEELNHLYKSKLDEKEMMKLKKIICKKYDFEPNNASILETYVYDALFDLTDYIYTENSRKESIRIFTTALRTASNKGFRKGVESLLKHYDGDKEQFRRVPNVLHW